jgi:hypothetical protein
MTSGPAKHLHTLVQSGAFEFLMRIRARHCAQNFVHQSRSRVS